MNKFDENVLEVVADCQDYYFKGEYVNIPCLEIPAYVYSRLYCDPSTYFTGYFNEQSKIKFKKDIKFEYTLKDIEEFHCRFEYESGLKNDGFRFKITKNHIVIKSSNDRGYLYAIRYINSLITEHENKIYLPIIEVTHTPTLRVRGVLEGFYGTPWTQEERLDEVDFMSVNKMNSFMYAPKNDPYHREKWAVEYPEKELIQLREIIRKCQEQYIDFYYAISPGNDINYTNINELKKIMNKFNQVIEVGVNKFVLLLDDIDYDLKGDTKIKFGSSGIAHAYLANQIYDLLKESLSVFELMLCPTEYMQTFETQYKKDLNENLNPKIAIMWTGPSIIPWSIHKKDVQFSAKQYNRELLIWDNVPCNDYLDKRMLSLTPYLNRTKELDKFNHIGIFSNAMLEWEASKITLSTMANYMWNSSSYNPIVSFKKSLKSIEPCMYEELMSFCEHHQNTAVYYTVPLHIADAIESGKKDVITKEIEKLVNLSEKLQGMSNKKLLSILMPWFEQIKAEMLIWTHINDGTFKENEYNQLKDAKVIISSQFILKYYEKNIKK
ncbi:beta-N-acetylglucosaminidase domain-containing protein [Clostridium sp. YIM B02515]|uniref:Beta-N-acetylglucosaminidase domain-containing protein n=1 Tax=Clostridium rhizosphaerae TaxID=2803861 RepID=A0ABS1TEN9_9CLOT|nr:protein O-GlcNAcase [Clostridium rhizosphaerae]MBL4937833.1 beta-N-acetylglucosaminidase domain-containing protein [Clostridium rhizosphaerae]